MLPVVGKYDEESRINARASRKRKNGCKRTGCCQLNLTNAWKKRRKKEAGQSVTAFDLISRASRDFITLIHSCGAYMAALTSKARRATRYHNSKFYDPGTSISALHFREILSRARARAQDRDGR